MGGVFDEKNVSEKAFVKWTKEREKGRCWHILKAGGLWGGVMFLWTVYINNPPELHDATLSYYLLELLIWGMAGFWFGRITWAIDGHSYQEQLKKRGKG